jgi:hypothetical protein
MLGSASRVKAAYQPACDFSWRVCPIQSHFREARGTAKRRAEWAFVSLVSDVSPILKLIERRKNKNGRKINCPSAPSAGTSGTSAKVTRFYGETTGLRQAHDKWDRRGSSRAGRRETVNPQHVETNGIGAA